MQLSEKEVKKKLLSGKEVTVKYSLKSIQTSEIPEVVRLVNSAYRGDSSQQGWTTEANYLDGQRTDEVSLAGELKDPNSIVLCLRSENSAEIIGTVFLEKYEDEKGPGCYLGMLTVKPVIQNGGIGKWVMNAVENEVRSWGVHRITLDVLSPRLELMAWYERRGFKRTGATKAFPYGQEQFGLPKQKNLHFINFEKKI